MELKKYPNAFKGTPMGDYLESQIEKPEKRTSHEEAVKVAKNRDDMAVYYSVCIFIYKGDDPIWQRINSAILQRWTPSGLEYIKKTAWKIIKANQKAPVDPNCCDDPETCVHAVCVTHAKCGLNDTIRTTPPDKHGVSEFYCRDCKEYFYASNP